MKKVIILGAGGSLAQYVIEELLQTLCATPCKLSGSLRVTNLVLQHRSFTERKRSHGEKRDMLF